MEDIILYRAGKGFKRDMYIGSITKEMDRFSKYKSIHSHKTYVMKFESNEEQNIYIFRIPGSTRGDIITDKENVIKEINFYKEAFECYQENITDYCGRFIGSRLIFKED